MTTFGKYLCSKRTEAGLLQGDVVKELKRILGAGSGYSQGTISRWEKERQLPPEEKVVRALAESLHADPEEMVALWHSSTPQPQETAGLKPEDYFEELKDELARYTTAGLKCESWFLGPDVVPALEMQLPREWWRTIMSQGHDYHFFWVLDYLSQHTLEKFGEVLMEMKSSDGDTAWLEGKAGRMFLHGFASTDGPASVYARKEYTQLMELANRKDFKWCEADFVASLDSATVEKLHGFTQSWATVICYFPKDGALGMPPFASASIDCLSTKLNSKEAKLSFFWFTNEKARALKDTIQLIKEQLPPFKTESK